MAHHQKPLGEEMKWLQEEEGEEMIRSYSNSNVGTVLSYYLHHY